MIANPDFSPVFDYRSAFEYSPRNINMKPVNHSKYKSIYSYHSVSTTSEDELDNLAKETWPSVLFRNIITFTLYLLVILLFPISFWICIKKVHALERIVLMRLGRLQPTRGPGFALILPCVDQWTRVDLRPHTFTVSASHLLTSDGGILEAKTDVEYQILNAISYVTKLYKQESTLKDLGLFCLTNIASEKEQEDLECNRELFNCNLKDALNESAINWGLEITNVNLHSVKVLKAAEPIDTIGTLMNALKAATGQSTEHTAVTFPFIPHASDCNVELSKTENLASAELKVLRDVNNMEHPEVQNVSSQQTLVMQKETDYVNVMQDLIDIAEKKGSLKDLVASVRLDIVGRSTRTVFCFFKHGTTSVFESTCTNVDCDVTLTISEDNFKDFVEGHISPLQAYMEGKIMVTGDWSLLRSFAEVFG